MFVAAVEIIKKQPFQAKAAQPNMKRGKP